MFGKAVENVVWVGEGQYVFFFFDCNGNWFIDVWGIICYDG